MQNAQTLGIYDPCPSSDTCFTSLAPLLYPRHLEFFDTWNSLTPGIL